MESLLIDLLRDPCGLSARNLKTMLQVVADDSDDETADRIEKNTKEVTLTDSQGNTVTRFVLDE